MRKRDHAGCWAQCCENAVLAAGGIHSVARASARQARLIGSATLSSTGSSPHREARPRQRHGTISSAVIFVCLIIEVGWKDARLVAVPCPHKRNGPSRAAGRTTARPTSPSVIV